MAFINRDNSNYFDIVFNRSRDLEYFNKDNVDNGKSFRKSEKAKETFQFWITIKNEATAWPLTGIVNVLSSEIYWRHRRHPFFGLQV